jgi:hypothetical protein
MAIKISKKSLKRTKPRWFCVANHFGTVAELAASGVKLQYVTERGDIAAVWRYIGNPKFRGDYAYLLVNFNPDTNQIRDIYAVRVDEYEKPRGGKNPMGIGGSLGAFKGDADKICFGWTSPQHARQLAEGIESCTGIPDHERDEL